MLVRWTPLHARKVWLFHVKRPVLASFEEPPKSARHAIPVSRETGIEQDASQSSRIVDTDRTHGRWSPKLTRSLAKYPGTREDDRRGT
jgi:hypothetical protein